jgi:hypothetical protein
MFEESVGIRRAHHLRQRRLGLGPIGGRKVIPDHSPVCVTPRRAASAVDTACGNHDGQSEHGFSTLLRTTNS